MKITLHFPAAFFMLGCLFVLASYNFWNGFAPSLPFQYRLLKIFLTFGTAILSFVSFRCARNVYRYWKATFDRNKLLRK